VRQTDAVPEDAANLDLAAAQRILRGDERAFRDLFDSFFPRLYRYVLARVDGDHDAASDIVQQSLCKGLEHLRDYRGEAALYTWFSQICRHTLTDYWRRMRRTEQLVQLPDDEPDVRAVLEAIAAPLDAQPEVEAQRSDVRRLVQATMDALPERYGDVLEWKYVDGLSVAAIATRLDIGAKAAESLLTRARGAFRAAILEVTGARAAYGHQQDWS
jgi:RNA polymerase sigma-70 factor, ECF subfamily